MLREEIDDLVGALINSPEEWNWRVRVSDDERGIMVRTETWSSIEWTIDTMDDMTTIVGEVFTRSGDQGTRGLTLALLSEFVHVRLFH